MAKKRRIRVSFRTPLYLFYVNIKHDRDAVYATLMNKKRKKAANVVGLIEEMYTFRAYNFPRGPFRAAGHKFTIATEFSRFHVRARDHNPLIF